MARVLVTGGAGYIGAHTVLRLAAAGHEISVLDDLSAGHRSSVPAAVGFHQVDLADAAATLAVVTAVRPEAVVHFAGAIEAGMSRHDPARFYRVNVVGSLALADALVTVGAPPLVYSSSAAVYGTPGASPIREDAATRPDSVYGRTKLDTEGVFAAYRTAYGLRSTALRYFNAAGAGPGTGLGELHKVETHLIPLAIGAVSGAAPMTVFGTDYPTPDGTCIRDYIHVQDLAEAHVLALDALLDGSPGRAYNVGVGAGSSVRAVLASVGRVTGTAVPVVEAGRRPGDPAELVADPSRITAELGWRPVFTDLDAIVSTAVAFHTAAVSHGPNASAAASKKP